MKEKDPESSEIESRINSNMGDALIEFEHKTVDLNTSFYPYILVLAMGIHAAFTGLALGVFNDKSAFYGFLLAIVLHKWAEALTIGISFSKSNIKKKRGIIMCLIFAIATPLGALIGLIFKDSNGIVKGVLLGISAGTFIYIAATEIIVEEFSGRAKKGAKYILFSLGIGFMVFLWFLEEWTNPDDDSNSDNQLRNITRKRALRYQ